jgi:hypothetical protein
VGYPWAYLDASLASVPYAEMHDKMAKRCLNPVEPCCTLYHIAVGEPQKHYKRDEEIHDET